MSQEQEECWRVGPVRGKLALVAFKLMQPFQVSMGVTTQEELDQLYQQLEMEIISDDFCSLLYLLTAWGKKSSTG